MREFARAQAAILLRRLAFQLNRVSRGRDPEAIHDLRTCIRRLSRCLRAFAPFFPAEAQKKVRRELRPLMQAAATVRDCDVAVELLHRAGVSPRAAVIAKLSSERRNAGRELLLQVNRWQGRNFSRKWRAGLEL